MQISHSEQVYSTFETLWVLLLDKVHHPDKTIKEITHVDLTTHDAGGITNNDINLARILNSLV